MTIEVTLGTLDVRSLLSIFAKRVEEKVKRVIRTTAFPKGNPFQEEHMAKKKATKKAAKKATKKATKKKATKKK